VDRIFTGLGSALALVAVGAGAFGAHALGPYFAAHPDARPTFETAFEYHLAHAVALILAGWAVSRWPGTAANAAGIAFTIGIVLFSGSLYLLALTRARAWGMVTPVGGVAFLAGWALLAWAAIRG
jgi:uncharacterized membrane protein YgdD (TMEM256/DUF423 family)